MTAGERILRKRHRPYLVYLAQQTNPADPALGVQVAPELNAIPALGRSDKYAYGLTTDRAYSSAKCISHRPSANSYTPAAIASPQSAGVEMASLHYVFGELGDDLCLQFCSASLSGLLYHLAGSAQHNTRILY